MTDDKREIPASPRIGLKSTVATLRRLPSAILLFVQLATLILYPFFEHADVGRTGLGILGIAVLALTMRMIQRTPFKTGIGLCLGVPASILLALQVGTSVEGLRLWSSALEAILYFYAAGSLIAYMVEDRRATRDELFAAAGTFTLIAWGFAHVFVLTQLIEPGSFTGAVQPQAPRTWTELVFLSFALLSSTGIGDIIPVRPPARGLASLEMFVGVIYLASVVSRLLGLPIHSHQRPLTPDTDGVGKPARARAAIPR